MAEISKWFKDQTIKGELGNKLITGIVHPFGYSISVYTLLNTFVLLYNNRTNICS